MKDKQTGRPLLLSVRATIGQRREKDDALCRAARRRLRGYSRIFVYVSMGSEADTRALIRSLYGQAEVPVPYTTDTMRVRRLLCADPPPADKRGNLPLECYGEATGQADIAVVPLLGFNRDLYRIGYGGGYYDRYLATFRGETVGLAYDEQLTEFLPQPHDIALNEVITPTTVLRRRVE